ncbi:universal stress protein [Mycobacterium sp. Marseille-P9652]|uniref:universal stress protein n=1 Tax=Mycobacterium sp. Marseille-P9652 TaxID=2654950 RepID=UPI0012E723E7|nr:universal stress protein [Mycobacterium sp. Marseille-P9652]
MWQPPRGAILVGVDGSAAALSAVRWAARNAATRKAPLAVVHVADGALPEWFDVAAPAGAGKKRKHEPGLLIESAIKVAEETTLDGHRVPLSRNVFHSATVPTLVGLSSEVEMVAVGRGGRGGALARTFLGSVSSALVHHARCPVAVIHDEKAVTGDHSRAPVLVGIDGSPASELATAIAFEEASRRGVRLKAMHVWADPRVSGSRAGFQDSRWDAKLSEEEETLAERLAGWHERYPEVGVSRTVEVGDPARRLVDASEQAQLVVVGSHGLGRFGRTLLGSVGAAVVKRAKVPVIVARQP